MAGIQDLSMVQTGLGNYHPLLPIDSLIRVTSSSTASRVSTGREGGFSSKMIILFCCFRKKKNKKQSSNPHSNQMQQWDLTTECAEFLLVLHCWYQAGNLRK